MVRLNKIYTKTGDEGSSGLVGGERRLKSDIRFEAIGAVDEVNAFLGMAAVEAVKLQDKLQDKLKDQGNKAKTDKIASMVSILEDLQHKLFDIGAMLATVESKGKAPIDDEDLKKIEHLIDSINLDLPSLKSFVLPGGNCLGALLHAARTFMRRAERRAITLSRKEDIDNILLKYLNRLSDLFFVMARQANLLDGQEKLWQIGRK